MPEVVTSDRGARAPDFEEPFPERVPAFVDNRLVEFLPAIPKDIEWSEDRPPVASHMVTNPWEFVQEYCWVVYASGFKASVVHQNWKDLRDAWMGFNPFIIAVNQDRVKPKAMDVIGYERKVDAIIEVCEEMTSIAKEEDTTDAGWVKFWLKYLDKVDDMTGLPFIGDTTKYHLARNLGHEVVKPDKHLERLTEFYSYDTPRDLVCFVSRRLQFNGHKFRLGTVDMIVWRYCTIYGTHDLNA